MSRRIVADTGGKDKTVITHIPPRLWARMVRERERRLELGGSLKPEITSIVLEALDLYLENLEERPELAETLQKKTG